MFLGANQCCRVLLAALLIVLHSSVVNCGPTARKRELQTTAGEEVQTTIATNASSVELLTEAEERNGAEPKGAAMWGRIEDLFGHHQSIHVGHGDKAKQETATKKPQRKVTPPPAGKIQDRERSQVTPSTIKIILNLGPSRIKGPVEKIPDKEQGKVAPSASKNVDQSRITRPSEKIPDRDESRVTRSTQMGSEKALRKVNLRKIRNFLPKPVIKGQCKKNKLAGPSLIHVVTKDDKVGGYDENGIIDSYWLPQTKIGKQLGFDYRKGLIKLKREGAYHLYSQLWYHSHHDDPTSEMSHCIVVGMRPDVTLMDQLVCAYSQPASFHLNATNTSFHNLNTGHISGSFCLARGAYIGVRMRMGDDHQAQEDCIAMNPQLTYFGAHAIGNL